MKRFVPGIILFLALPVNALELDPDGNRIKKGTEDYKKQEYSSSLNEFNAVGLEDPRVNFNKGTALYKLGDYDGAIKEFRQSAAKGKESELKKKSFYNLGNSFQKKGDKKNAASSYVEALKLDPAYGPARKNLDLLNRKDSPRENEKQDQKEQPQNENQQDGKDNRKQEQKDQESGTDPKDGKEKREAADRMFKSGNPEDIKRRKMNPENRSKNDNFW